MKFSEAPVDAILVVGNTADGPVLAKKLGNKIDNGHVVFNAHWTNEQGELRGTCVIMEDQQVEIYSIDDANLVTDKPAKSKRGTGKRARGGGAGGRVSAAGSDSGGASVG
jgi:hypothetical protein